MRHDAVMAKYRKDPRVVLIVKTGKSLQQENALYRSGDRLPPLGASAAAQ